jgi:phage-related protein
MIKKVDKKVFLHAEIKSPPLSEKARIETGHYLRLLQKGRSLNLPHSRPMSIIGSNCHELRINDENITWRIYYYIDADAIVVLEVSAKKTEQTSKKIIERCQNRLSYYFRSYED